jgi:hypothetical protein
MQESKKNILSWLFITTSITLARALLFNELLPLPLHRYSCPVYITLISLLVAFIKIQILYFGENLSSYILFAI